MKRNSIYSEYDEYFYLTYSKSVFLFYVSWLLYIKQQSSETTTSWQMEIRIHWINTRWNKILYFLYCLLKMVFNELDSKILLIKLTTDEGKIKWWVKNWEITFQVKFADSKLGRKKENREDFLMSQQVQNENALAAVLKGNGEEDNDSKSHKNRKHK